SLVKQRTLGQTADAADWLIGEGILGPALPGKALRSMIEPGTAYDGDTQPRDMDGYRELPNDEDDDFGGVHQYSSIPNRAFCIAVRDGERDRTIRVSEEALSAPLKRLVRLVQDAGTRA